MKRSHFSFKLLTIITAFVIIGCFQLAASQAQEARSSDTVPVTIFANAYKHIPGLAKYANKIIRTVRNEFKLDNRGMDYHRVAIDVIDENNDAEGDFLFVYFLLKNTYTSEISKIALASNYEVLWIENGYKLKHGETSTEWLDSESCDCPDPGVEIVLSTCCTDIPTAVAGIEYSYDAAVSAGYNTVKLLGSQENTTDIDKWLCCPNLKYWGRIGHGYTGGIVLDDGNLTYSYFDSLPTGALLGKSLYFNSCQVFNDPLKSSILNKDAYKFIGGICNLYIGSSEEVFKCWNDKNFYQVPPPGGEPDEMCYWSVECESSTGYPEPGCHGCGGPGLIFREPGGLYPPVADFSSNPTILGAGGTVYFTDLSTNIPTAWSWTFEGGTPATSTEQNPEVIYNTVGTYNVSLTASNSQGSDTETKIDHITVTVPQIPVADFSASSTSVFVGDSVEFTDLSLNTPTAWNWTFEGGTPATSTDRNPTVTYNTPGLHTVTLTASNSAGSDTETKVDYMYVELKPYCDSQGTNFSMEWIERVQVASMDNTSGAAGYTDFTSITCDLTGGNTVNVSLTPGFSGSTYTEYWRIWIDYNGDHDFEDAGEEVFSGYGSSTVTGSFTVASDVDIVTRMRVSMKYAGYPSPCETFTYGEVEDYTADVSSGICPPPVADFAASATIIYEGDSVTFTDLSTNGPNSLDWSFDGGIPATSTQQNPTVTYNTAGTYDVSLTATNICGSDTETKVDYITVQVQGQPPTADFTFTTNNLTAYFTDTSTDPDGTIVAWDWDFGDGNTSTEQNPIHTYAADGTYTVTLTVTDNDSLTGTTSKPVTVTGPVVEIYVYDITQTIKKMGRNYESDATVTIRDTNNNPVAGATVSITWSGVVSGTDSGVTGADGTVTFTSDKVKSTGPFTITVNNVTHATMTYNPTLNIETSDTAYY
jgi:PKD repeat protein